MSYEMASRYAPAEMEKQWYEFWCQRGYFQPQGEGEAYTIMLPPPNVTGTLHMGHAFQDTLMDTLIRYQRMNGKKTLWQVGSDHAGIATQMVVERQLNAAGQSRHDLGRSAFVDKIWAWKALSGGKIMEQLRRLGAAADWSRERFTMDEGLSAAVKTVFVRLYRDGLIYRGKRLVNWDPVLKTAISDLEVENREEQGFMYHVRYPFVAGQGLDGEFMHIATTRPETILADGALAVHPEDERYRHLVGKKVHVPLTERVIPIIADAYVEQDFGTGCVKITPAHDFNDYAVGQRHEMEIINLMHPDARLNDNAPPAYRGLDRWEAREKIIADLQSASLLEKIEPHLLKRPYGDRSGAVIEPYLTDQWFVDLSSEYGQKRLLQPALAAVREGRMQFTPKNWEKTYFNWLENIEDWCISRQLWWGHNIPAWYDGEGRHYVGFSEAEARQHYGLAAEVELRPDEDVLDTWFSSALWPFSTLGWPEKTADLSAFYPSSVLVTGFDIIFFWVARMMMMGLYFMGDVPFREVYIHGLVRDGEGQKMSKSKGNVLDPLDIIDGIDLESLLKKRTTGLMKPEQAPAIEAATRKEFPEGIPACGTDALRFTFCALATSGRDVVFDMGRVEGSRNFCNKLWNASRFVLMQSHDRPREALPRAQKSMIDRWILSALDETTAQVRAALDAYRFDFAAQALYEFIWNQYCDWYLELSKPVLSKNNTNEAEKAATRHTLLQVLEGILRLAHPLMPFITEALWQELKKVAPELAPVESLLLMPYPQPEQAARDEEAEATVKDLQEALLGLRKIRAEMNIAPGKTLNLLWQPGADGRAAAMLRHLQREYFALGKIQSLEALPETAPEAATFMLGESCFYLPLAGLIDKQAELARLDKEIAKLEKNVQRLQQQLNNERFLAQAPAELVAQQRQQFEGESFNLHTLRAQREKIAQLEA